jgi:hypothetical protein
VSARADTPKPVEMTIGESPIEVLPTDFQDGKRGRLSGLGMGWSSSRFKKVNFFNIPIRDRARNFTIERLVAVETVGFQPESSGVRAHESDHVVGAS